MISRRLIRIKILQVLYAYYNTSNPSLKNAEKEFHHSINRTYYLYFYIIDLLIELQKYAERKIDAAKQKKVPTYEDLNPNTKFADNQVIKFLRSDTRLNDFLQQSKISWANHQDFIKKIFETLVHSENYISYMKSEKTEFQEDKRFIIKYLSKDIIFNEEFYNILEDISIYWNDEIDFIISLLTNNIRKINPNNGNNMILPVYKNEEDKEYAISLLRKSIIHYDEYKKLVDEATTNWDIERIAFMDVLIMIMAITEILEFQSIPVKVSFNEYIEVSKLYSTNSSSNFINGILDKIIQKLRKANRIIKTGRGLIGEV